MQQIHFDKSEKFICVDVIVIYDEACLFVSLNETFFSTGSACSVRRRFIYFYLLVRKYFFIIH